MATSWNFVQPPDPVLSNSIASNYHCASCTPVCYLLSIQHMSLSRFKHNDWAKYLCSVTHTVWVLLDITNFDITATSDRSLQEDRNTMGFLFVVFLTWFFHPCWKSWNGAPIFSQRMELYVNVGIVNTLVLSFFPIFFLEHFYVFEKHVIYSKQLLLSWFLVICIIAFVWIKKNKISIWIILCGCFKVIFIQRNVTETLSFLVNSVKRRRKKISSLSAQDCSKIQMP